MGWKSWFRRRRWEQKLDAELRFHIEQQIEEFVRAGLTQEEARRRALLEFGGVDQIKEECRDSRSLAFLEALLQDIRYALRQMKRSPGFTIVVVLTLALGIGANTAIFSLMDAVMLRMLPVRQPEELMLIADPLHPGQVMPNALWEAFREGQDAFSSVFAWSQRSFDLAQGGEAQNVDGIFVSGDYFKTLGVGPSWGRLLTTNDDFRGCPSIAVLSYSFWQSHFGGDQQAVGRLITLDGHRFQVVGVSAAGFFGVVAGNKFDVAVPICAGAIFNGPSWFGLSSTIRMMGRLKPGLNADQASTKLAALSPAIFAASFPKDWKPDPRFFSMRLGALPGATGFSGSGIRRTYGPPLQTLMVVVGLVLLIACSNMACIMLARATARKKEIAVRLAVGASRWRLIRQLLTECLLLSLAGACVGLFVARWGFVLLVRFISTPLYSTVPKIYLDFAFDWRVLGFTAVAAVLAGILFGVLPSVLSTRASLISAMKGQGEEGREHRRLLRPSRWILSGEVALSLVLLLVAGLFLKSFWKLISIDAGFDPKNVLLVKADLHSANIPEGQRSAVLEEIATRMRALPGVTSVAHSMNTPFSGFLWGTPIHFGGPSAPSGCDADCPMNFISPGFFETLRTRLLSGRVFTESDTAQAQPVSIISQAMARKFFSGDNPIGKYFTAEIHGQPPKDFLVIGVVADSKVLNIRENFRAQAYYPAAQMTFFQSQTPTMQPWNFEIRTGLRSTALEKAAEDAVVSVNKAISLQFITLEQQVNNSITQERLLAALSGFFGGLAVLLAMIGVYGVLSYMVTQRRNEIGIRMALGASQSSIVIMIVGHGLKLALTGAVIGLIASFALTRFVASLLFGVTATDPFTYVAVSIVLIAVAGAASYVPARRAARVDPMQALRAE